VQQRLQKILAAAGVNSRRKCEELILEGSVSVNGKVVDSLPVFADPEKDVIAVNGRKIRQEQKVYFLLNKPKNVICTNFDPQGRTKAIDLVPATQRIFCVGRLDTDTTGLIILTNDSELANRLTHPRYELPKTYIAEVKGLLDEEIIEKLKKGVWLTDSRTAEAPLKILRRSQNESLLEITIRQGLNPQIRRILAKLNLNVKSLKRTRIGKIDAKGLGAGEFRPLTGAEVAYLKKITSQ
jgi:23S rRNA pseudouridine2605 synthase